MDSTMLAHNRESTRSFRGEITVLNSRVSSAFACALLAVALHTGLTPRAEADPWTPSNLATNPALWLDAADSSKVLRNGSSVTNWLDKSGNNRTFAQTNAAVQPTYAASGLNGLSVIDFAADYLTSTQPSNTWKFMHDGTTKYSIFAVCKFYGDAAVTTESYVLLGDNAGNSPNHGFYVSFDDRKPPTTSPTRINRLQFQVSRGVSGQVTVGSLNGTGDDNFWLPNQYQVAGFDVDPSNGTAANRYFARRNGAYLINDNASLLTPSSSDPTCTLDIGAGGNGAVPLTGGIAELLITSNAVSAEVRQKIEGYLAWKWGLQGSLPADHPYKTRAPALPGTVIMVK